MADVKNPYHVCIDSEQNSVNMGLAAVQQLPYFKRKVRALWGMWTAFRKCTQ